ncbi:hypothetical protein G9A89_011347 [Geosiphon pyriformis]|nr:hypothetical protein G9A89_011347 [Geosiphon pyriformis]
MSHPNPRGRKPLPEEEDASKLAFGEDFDSAEFLFISEAALLLDRTPPSQAQTSAFQKTQTYVSTFSKFHNQEAVTELRKTLLKYGIHKYELAQLANLCPEEVDEVKSLIPSLARKNEDEDIRQMLDEIAALKNVLNAASLKSNSFLLDSNKNYLGNVGITKDNQKNDALTEENSKKQAINAEEFYQNIVDSLEISDEKEIIQKIDNQLVTPNVETLTKVFFNFVKKKEKETLITWFKSNGLTDNEFIGLLENYDDNKDKIDESEASLDSKKHSDTYIPHDLEKWKESKLQEITNPELKFLIEKAPKPSLSFNLIGKIINRCFAQRANGKPDHEFYPSQIVEYLIRNKYLVDNILQEGIVRAIIEREKWDSLVLLLRYNPDISEKDLVFLLQYFITLSNNEFDNVTIHHSHKEALVGSTSPPNFDYILSMVIRARRDEFLMQRQLQTLTVDELSKTLEILCEWMGEIIHLRRDQEIKNDNDNMQESKSRGYAPPFNMVLDFLTLLIDAHFSTLILTNDLHPLLQRLLKYIATELSITEAVQTTLGFLRIFYEEKKTKERKKRQQYPKRPRSKQKLNGTQKGQWGSEVDVPQYSVEILRVFDDDWLMESDDEDVDYQLVNGRKAKN